MIEGKQASEFIDEDVSVSWNGTNGSITGNIKYVEGYSAYPAGEDSGNYFPLVLDSSYEGKPITVKRTSGTKSEKTVADTKWVLRLTDNKDTKYEISSNGVIIAVLNFSGATLAEGE